MANMLPDQTSISHLLGRKRLRVESGLVEGCCTTFMEDRYLAKALLLMLSGVVANRNDTLSASMGLGLSPTRQAGP